MDEHKLYVILISAVNPLNRCFTLYDKIWVRSPMRSVYSSWLRSLPQALLPSVNIYLCGRAFSFCLWCICGRTSATVQRTTVRALVSGGDIWINPCITETRRTTRERLSVNSASPSSSPSNTNPQPPPLHPQPHHSPKSVFVICLGYIIQRGITNHYLSAHKKKKQKKEKKKKQSL